MLYIVNMQYCQNQTSCYKRGLGWVQVSLMKTEVRFLTGKLRCLESCITVVSKNRMRQNISFDKLTKKTSVNSES